MKTLLLLVLFVSSIGYSQTLKWGSVPSNALGFDPNGKVEIVNGKFYQIITNANNRIVISEYKPALLKWQKLDSISFSITPTYVVTSKHNTTIYVSLKNSAGQLNLYKFNTVTEALTPASTTLTIGFSANTHLFIHPTGVPYIITYGYYDPLFVYKYNGSTWESLDLGTIATSNTGGDLRYYYYASSTNELFIGISDNNRKVVKIPLSSFSLGTTVVSDILLSSVPLTSGKIDFIGDGVSIPTIVHSRNTGSYVETFQLNYLTTTMDVTGLPSMGIFIDETHSFVNEDQINLKFGASGVATTLFDQQILRKFDGSWSNLGPAIDPASFDILTYKELKADPNTNKYFARLQENISYQVKGYALSNTPTVSSAPVPNTALCVGSINEIYSSVEIEDLDGEYVQVLSVLTSNQSVYSNLTAHFKNFNPGTNITKFEIFGKADLAGTSTDISVVVTDGFVIDTLLLGTVTPTSTVPSLTFSDPNMKICSNENLVDLTDKVSFYDGGKFFLNGVQLAGTNVSGIQLAAGTLTPGTDNIQYITLIDGCLVKATTFYEISTVGTAATSSTGAINCGDATGSVSVIFTPGSVPAVSVEWSNGQSDFTIDSLEVGPYYFNVTDQNGCNVRGGVSVNPTGISVSSFVTPISCNGSNDGGISLTLSGFTNPYVIWSNGYNGLSVSNLKPGTYWAYVQDDNGCNVSRSFQINEPAKIEATFSTYDPDCGYSNGVIYGSYTGGVGTYSYDWIGTGQTTGNLNGVTYGYYEVVVSDQNGCTEEFDIELNDYQALLIKDSVIPTTCIEQNGAILINQVNNPFGVLPYLSHTWSDGSNFLNRAGLDSGLYILDMVSGPNALFNNCHSIKHINVGVKMPTSQQICVVTVDTTTTTNIVIWEKNGEENISHYNIYRENTQAGHYMLIDTVNFSNESNFNDVIASPEIRSWRYRISPVNTCGVEGPLSIAHKTLHMNSIITNANGTQILWDDYEGPADISHYIVWRYSTQNGWQTISPSIPLSTSSFTDMNTATLTNIDYLVETVMNSTCTAEKINDFNSSRSNREKGTFAVGEGTGASNNSIIEINGQFELYPNPANEWIVINSLMTVEATTFELINIHGLVISKHEFNGTSTKIDLSELPTGYYFIRISGESQGIPFIKN